LNWRFTGPIVAAVAVIGVVVIGSLAAQRPQDEARTPTAEARQPTARHAPRAGDSRVDFSGIWSPDRNFIYDLHDALKKGETLPLQPWAETVARGRLSKDDPEANCLPAGVPRQAPYPWRILQTATHVFFLFEGNIHSYRQIFMDGRTHPDDPNPTWYGHSIGRWDGETLVVDTVGFNDRFWFDFAGHPHTERLHIVERYRRPDFDHLDYEITVDDPGAYTRPFTLHGHSTYQNGEELMEYICNENNKDLEHIVGKDPRNVYSRK